MSGAAYRENGPASIKLDPDGASSSSIAVLPPDDAVIEGLLSEAKDLEEFFIELAGYIQLGLVPTLELDDIDDASEDQDPSGDGDASDDGDASSDDHTADGNVRDDTATAVDAEETVATENVTSQAQDIGLELTNDEAEELMETEVNLAK